MNREEKNYQTRQKIIEGAFAEFSKHSYTEASLNAICVNSGISKGIIYHYFKDKEDLYLYCVQKVFTSLTQYLEFSCKNTAENITQYIKQYMDARFTFFQENPHYTKLFCDSILPAPNELAKEIHSCKEEFLSFNQRYYEVALTLITLRSTLTKEDAMRYFSFLQDSFHTFFSKNHADFGDSYSLFQAHDAQLEKLLEWMLYGIVKEDVL